MLYLTFIQITQFFFGIGSQVAVERLSADAINRVDIPIIYILTGDALFFVLQIDGLDVDDAL